MLRKFFLLFLSPAVALSQSFQYDLKITPEKYDLSIHMKFSQGITVADAVRGFKNEVLLVAISDSIKNVIFVPPGTPQYQQTMKVRSFGITSYLVSNCQESSDKGQWRRECQYKARTPKLARIQMFPQRQRGRAWPLRLKSPRGSAAKARPLAGRSG